MQIAQALYEGVDLGGSEGTQGLITYMRTDSTRIADSARDAAREFVDRDLRRRVPWRRAPTRFAKAPRTRTKRFARPAVFRTPESVAHVLKRDELRLYSLIWERFVASQMAPAIFDQTTVDIKAGEYTFRATGSVVEIRRLHPRL